MFNYTDAVPNYNNFITIRLTYIILGTFVFVAGYFVGLKKITFCKQSVMQFYKKRLLRIYPLYLIAIGLFTFFHLSDIVTAIKAAFVMSMLIKPAPPTLWFITMLMLFYIVSPLIMVASKTIKMCKLILYFSICMSCLLAYHYLTKLLDLRLLMYFPSFVLGVFVAGKNINIFQKKHLIFILAIISIFISFLKTPYNTLNLSLNTPMVILCSYLLFLAAKNFVVASNRIYKSIIFLSYSSYCMYLFHRPIYITLKKIYFPETYLCQVVYLVIICLPCILFSSFIIQKTYDITLHLLTRRLRWTGQSRAAFEK